MTLRTGSINAARPAGIKPLSARVALHMHSIPAAFDWTPKCVADGDARSNDQFGCCVECADFALIEVVLANIADSGDARWKPTVDMILARYAALTGFNPATGLPDDGTDTAADLAAWVASGIKLPELQRDIAPWWATVDPTNDDHLAIALACAPLLVSLDLPVGWDAIEADPTAWSKPPGPWQSSGEGHRVLAVKFAGAVRTVRTWGMDVEVHPDWWRQAVVAVDAVWSTDLLNALGTTPMGLDLAALNSDMQEIAA